MLVDYSIYTSEQTIFDHIVDNLIKQNYQCNDYLDECCYRANNRKCAAGWAIRDEDYKKSMEGKNINEVIHQYNLLYLEPYNDLLMSLQSIHDNTDTIFWLEEFKLLAEDWNLNWNF